ncbi:Kdo hydroxylase family protein [Pantoea sp. App145]|uniref:Kdo hydroxylase family protein n=1 Tax=Pantoea sp. App145 TaxID=3071567 RepID=UPI003A8027BF
MGRVGETFPTLAQRFLPRLKGYSPLLSRLLYTFVILKILRSHHHHLIFQLQDAMEAEPDYLKNCPHIAIEFPSASSLMFFPDETTHAAIGGQFMLEQTYLLPVEAMQEPQHAPLNTLQTLLYNSLI